MTEEKMREALRTVQLAKLNGLFDAAVANQINGDVESVFAEVDAALSTKQEAGEVSRSQTAQALEEAAAKIKALGDHIDPTTNDKWDHGYLTAITGALDAIRALSLPAPDGSSAAAAAPFEQDTQKAAASTLVFCVRCIDGDGDVVHIFSSKATLQTFLDADQRSHVIYDYVIDCPERTEQVKQ